MNLVSSEGKFQSSDGQGQGIFPTKIEPGLNTEPMPGSKTRNALDTRLGDDIEHAEICETARRTGSWQDPQGPNGGFTAKLSRDALGPVL